MLKTLDGYQWVLFMIAHSERHQEQVREIKAGIVNEGITEYTEEKRG